MSESRIFQKGLSSAERRRLSKQIEDYLTVFPHDLSLSLWKGNPEISTPCVQNSSPPQHFDVQDAAHSSQLLNSDLDGERNVSQVDAEDDPTERNFVDEPINEHLLNESNQELEDTEEIEISPSFSTNQFDESALFPLAFKENVSSNDYLVEL